MAVNTNGWEQITIHYCHRTSHQAGGRLAPRWNVRLPDLGVQPHGPCNAARVAKWFGPSSNCHQKYWQFGLGWSLPFLGHGCLRLGKVSVCSILQHSKVGQPPGASILCIGVNRMLPCPVHSPVHQLLRWHHPSINTSLRIHQQLLGDEPDTKATSAYTSTPH